ncbi:uncharacterized protein EI97DRAFT_454899 [Westerdykella ornata]|uniref:Uncharacterized protein n=1 Tax=Westerdykella ornata TaxID=318751 RepID=A0A6A6JVW5_WESOR|nr:uncharacterized protein EI97DRAFT_454899 [Westerdykella ornata]KAF2279958.1 hypothetical protein EI97DRAFT_454899 [Westerdykella ornata]
MANPIPLSPAQAHTLSNETRNELYSALLSSTGILNIEATLTHELQRSGWLDSLKQYITQLLRTGEATTVDQIMAKVREKTGLEALAGEHMNGGGAATNGVNGVNGVNGHEAGEGLDLKIPIQALAEGSKTIRRELEKVCEIAGER